MTHRRRGHGHRRAVAVLFAALLALCAAAPAHGADYRYWSFWQRGDGDAWVYATQGPSIARPDDGDVDGFRFAVSADAETAKKPRGSADFDTICADTKPAAGKKRIAVVIDFGTAADAPGGKTPPKPRTACARIDDGGSSADALAAVAEPLRYDTNALLCAISDYPKTGCGEQVSGDSGDRSEQGADEGDGGPSVGLLAGIAAVVVLGAAGVWQARRRRG
ncbi:SCO2322 family protein [Streptomyces sp. NRRL B-1347]|uniref:SCO2322 family protein n=1 Tax=Streptomyces sp. NRRL B-1347 TaxID=1476877 RepID=UPI0004CB9BB2|nr:SCO2322 family protein [Streptomyces sp. NRRL B-1347]